MSLEKTKELDPWLLLNENKEVTISLSFAVVVGVAYNRQKGPKRPLTGAYRFATWGRYWLFLAKNKVARKLTNCES